MVPVADGIFLKIIMRFIKNFISISKYCIIQNMESFLKKGIVFVLLLGFVLPAFADELTDDLFDIAKNYYSQGNKAKTLEYLEQILQIDANNPHAIELKIRLEEPKINKPLPDVFKPLVFDVPFTNTSIPEIDNAHNQGIIAYKNKDYLKAEQCFLQAINNGGQSNYRLFNTLGLIYWAQRKIDEAKSAFIKSNELNSVFSLPIDNLAQIYKQTGDFANAKKYIEQSIKSNPKDFCAYLIYGDYYRDCNDYSRALQNYRKVINLNPKYKNAYLKIAITRSDELDFSGSNATLNYYLKLYPTDDFAYLLIAKNYQYMNDFEKAKEAVCKAILLNNSYEYRAELGKILYYSGDIKVALEVFLQSVNKQSDAEIYNYIGMCYFNLHQFNKAITYLNKAIDLPNYRIIYHYNLAKVYETLKDDISYERCMNYINDFCPESYQDYIDKANILFDSQSKSSAIILLNKGIQKFPYAKELYLEKLKIYDLTDDTEGANSVKNEVEQVFKQ